MSNPYVANRFDCVEFVLQQIGITSKRRVLPEGWHFENNFMIQDICKALSGENKIKISSIIFSIDSLKKGDVVIMRLRGKFAHHMAIYIGEKHINHCVPGIGITQSMLMPRFFLFGVRLWE